MAAWGLAAAVLVACGDRDRAAPGEGEPRVRLPPIDRSELDPKSTRAPRPVIYVVSEDGRLFSFDPRLPGRDAYGLVGELACKSRGHPRSMGIDRRGTAWVFYDTGELFRVDVTDASCASTPYVHPSPNTMLGMGFTSDAPGAATEKLYVMSPSFGLAWIDLPTLRVEKTGALAMSAELTGGGDARLFAFEADGATLFEIDRSDMSRRHVHTFDLHGVRAWAFARYAGRFYVFTARGFEASRTTELDPKTGVERLRDANVGFVIVGAGQSTLVPYVDGRA